MDIRDFDRWLDSNGVRQGFGAIGYDDSAQKQDGTFYIRFYVDPNEIDEDDAADEIEDEMLRIESGPWRYEGIDDVWGNRRAVNFEVHWTYEGNPNYGGGIAQWLD